MDPYIEQAVTVLQKVLQEMESRDFCGCNVGDMPLTEDFEVGEPQYPEGCKKLVELFRQALEKKGGD